MKIEAHWILALGAIAVVMTAILIVGRTSAPATEHSLRPGDAGVVARGGQVYRAHCASCHGARLEGQPNWRERGADGRLPAPPHDASGHTWHHPDGMLFRLTKHGVAKVAKLKDYNSTMPIYDGVLNDEEIIAVLSWIKAQWPPEIRARHDQLNRPVQP